MVILVPGGDCVVDHISKEDRSKNMRAIGSKNTKLEERISKALWHRGFRFRKNVKVLKGKPDIAIQKYRAVIFIDSCFWHGCPLHGRLPKSNEEYWELKIERNKARDQEVTQYYIEYGWDILRIWEHNVRHNFDETINNIVQFLNKAKKRHSRLS